MEFIRYFFQYVPEHHEIKTIEAEKRIDIEDKTEHIEHVEPQPIEKHTQ